ncbi:MAG TPA: GWxTD domain-containing protein [Candidatus Krumholzibacteria bacterium]|nr:GWxTD domain-containing protein [Candidatus Krumholzibacteria bacterium]
MLLVAPSARAGNHSGRGDFDFFLDSASFRGKDGKTLTEVSIRIPGRMLKFSQENREWKSHVELSILIKDDAGKDVVRRGEKVTFTEPNPQGDEDPISFETVIKQFLLAPGGYWISYQVEDLNAPKLSVMGLVKSKNKTSIVSRARLNVPEIPDDEPSFSNAMFVWDVNAHESGLLKYRPNPSRIYGLYRDTLTVYVELYLPASMASSPTFGFRSEIVTPGGDLVHATERSLSNPRPAGEGMATYPVVLREDLTKVRAGRYSLYLTFSLDGNTLTRVNSGDFSVAWDLRTWETPRREYLAEARFLLGDREYKNFVSKAPGEQERELDAMWKSLDPDTTTSNNEVYDEFMERLDYVNAHYSDEPVAIYSQRGDIYLRYGPPDEIIQDVIPSNYETLGEAEKVIDNPYHPLNMSSSGQKLYSVPKTRNTLAGEGSTARYRPEDNTSVPYELWIYNGGGQPLLERDRVTELEPITRFLFLDRDGHGVYKLEKSSSISNK